MLEPNQWAWLDKLGVPGWVVFIAGGMFITFKRVIKDLDAIGKKLGIFKGKTESEVAQMQKQIAALCYATGNKEILALAQEPPTKDC